METSAPDSFDITELARRAEVSPRTIRYYEELGLLEPIARGAGGRRLYDGDALGRLRFISRLKSLGLTLEEIGDLARSFARGQTPAMLDDLDAMLTERIDQVADRIRELEHLRDELVAYRDRIRRKRRR